MIINKKLSIGLFVLASAAVLTACSGSAKDDTKSVASVNNTEAVSTAAGGKLKQEEQYSYIEFEDIFEQMKAEDLEGNNLDSSLFANADVTMINIWGTFCPPCIEEMPDLGEINRAYSEDKNKDGSLKFQIVGLVGDTAAPGSDGYMYIDQKVISKAKDIIEKTKADYKHIVPTGNFGMNLLGTGNISYFPSTIFVDKEGDIIETSEGEIVIGAHRKQDWEKLIAEVIREEVD